MSWRRKAAPVLMALMLVIGVLAAACSPEPEPENGENGEEAVTAEVQILDAAPDDDLSQVLIVLTDDDFNEDVYGLVEGEETLLVVENQGQLSHTFTVDAFNIDETLNAEEIVYIRLTATGTGETGTHCRFHDGMDAVFSVAAAE